MFLRSLNFWIGFSLNALSLETIQYPKIDCHTFLEAQVAANKHGYASDNIFWLSFHRIGMSLNFEMDVSDWPCKNFIQ